MYLAKSINLKNNLTEILYGRDTDCYYNIERMLKSVVVKGGSVKACGGCVQARGIDELQFIKGVELSNMKDNM